MRCGHFHRGAVRWWIPSLIYANQGNQVPPQLVNILNVLYNYTDHKLHSCQMGRLYSNLQVSSA